MSSFIAMDTLNPHLTSQSWQSSHLTNIDYARKFEAKKCNSNSSFLSLISLIFIEPQNVLFFEINSDFIWGFGESIAINVIFTYIGAHPEYLTLIYNLDSNTILDILTMDFQHKISNL